MPSHQGILGNDKADQLATQAIEAATSGEILNRNYGSSIENASELVQVASAILDESSSEENVQQPEKENVRTELEKSINKFNENMNRSYH